MKKIIALLIVSPILLITSLNMYSGFEGYVHKPYMKSLTCSSCHATIVNGIIVGGKNTIEDDYINISIEFNNNINYEAILLNIKGIKNPKIKKVLAINNDLKNTSFSLALKNDIKKPNKKAHLVYLKYPLKELDKEKEISIEGVYTNADGTSAGEYSFSKKITLNKTINVEEKNKDVVLFPSIASSKITLKNLKESATISIINYSGKMVFYKENVLSKELIDISNLPNGFYFANVSKGKTIKFIIKK